MAARLALGDSGLQVRLMVELFSANPLDAVILEDVVGDLVFDLANGGIAVRPVVDPPGDRSAMDPMAPIKNGGPLVDG
jgi:hypothetical protein